MEKREGGAKGENERGNTSCATKETGKGEGQEEKRSKKLDNFSFVSITHAGLA